MEGVLADKKEDTLQHPRPQQTSHAVLLGLPPDQQYRGNGPLPGSSSVSLPDTASGVTQPPLVAPGENESSTDLLSAPAPFARGTSLISRPSTLSLDETDRASNNAEPRHTVSVKPSLASLPESPVASHGATLSPIPSVTTAPNVAPAATASLVKAAKSTTVPLAPAHDLGKWRSRYKGYKRSLGDFFVRHFFTSGIIHAHNFTREFSPIQHGRTGCFYFSLLQRHSVQALHFLS